MIKLSAVIITFNEEQNIARCLDSLKNVADEIVVLDSFSTDRTPDICKEYGVKFFQHAFDGHIQQKNRVITYASNPHCLSVDADEVLSHELEKSILQIKENFTADGYYFNRLTWYCSRWIRHCGWYPDRKLRLWDSRKGGWTGVNPHDRYEMKEGCKTAHLKGDLLHYSYYTLSQHLAQVEKFTTIAAKADVERGRGTSLFKIMFYPFWKFTRDYIFKLGFLDGYQGYLVCRISAQAAFYKNIKIWELKRKNKFMASAENKAPECCPPFDPALWEDKTLNWENKLFVKDKVCTFMYMPIRFGKVMVRLNKKVSEAGAAMPGWLCMSDHTSSWNMDLYIAVDKEIPNAEMVRLSGNFFSKVYEGPYKDTGKWCKDYESIVKSKGLNVKKWYMWYTTCPKCAKKYGKNYVVIIGKVE